MFMNRHLQKSQNNYDSHTNTTILSRRLCICFTCCLCHFLPTFFFLLVEWFESFEPLISIISIFLNAWFWMSRSMNQTYFECYEFDVSAGLILIATCTYKSLILKISLVVMSSEKAIHCWFLSLIETVQPLVGVELEPEPLVWQNSESK